MEYFAPAFRELQRIVVRFRHGATLSKLQRKLAAAETELGLLGWQQADFDEATQSEVNKIHDAEREQGRLTNASADVARKISALSEERVRTRAESTSQRQELEEQKARLTQDLETAEDQFAGLKKKDHDIDRRIPDLDREQADVDELYMKLLVIQPQSAQVRDELFRLRDRLIAIPNEKADLRAQRPRVTADLRTREKEVSALKADLAVVDEKLRALKEKSAESESRLTSELREKERAKAQIEADGEKLELNKLNPYREIGRVLADSHLGPLNQPHILKGVQALRAAVQEHEQVIVRTKQVAAAEDRAALRVSFALWALIFVAIAIFVAALF